MIPDIGDEFLMEFPLPPGLQEAYGKESMIVEAIYEGVLDVLLFLSLLGALLLRLC
jgi:hypothetical protein